MYVGSACRRALTPEHASNAATDATASRRDIDMTNRGTGGEGRKEKGATRREAGCGKRALAAVGLGLARGAADLYR
jgi:hypothetical protein